MQSEETDSDSKKGLWKYLLPVLAVFCIFAILMPSATVRYRLTLYAEDYGQPITGSAVSEFSYSKNILPGQMNEYDFEMHGEAVVLDLGSKGKLFALLEVADNPSSEQNRIILTAFGLPGDVPRPVHEGLRIIRDLSGVKDLPLTQSPVLARFADLNDPATIVQVDPLDLSKTFGAGVTLNRITIEVVTGIWPLRLIGITGQPLSASIASVLPWLSGYYSRRLDGERYVMRDAKLKFANSVNARSFKMR